MGIPLPDRKVGCYYRQGLIKKIRAASNIGQNDFFLFFFVCFFFKKENQKFNHI